MRLLDRSAARQLLAHPWQIGLSVLGVALGVAVVVGIDLANASASRAFDLATESITGRATHQVTGGPGGLGDELYTRLVVEGGVRPAAPVVESHITGRSADGTALTLRLLGVDPLAEAPFRPYLAELGTSEAAGGGTAGGGLGAFMTRPGAVVASRRTAEMLGVSLGESFEIEVEGTSRRLELVGLLTPEDERSRRALDTLLVADVATAQESLGRVGRLDRIDLLLAGEGTEDGAAAERIEALLPPGARLEPAASRSEALAGMTDAFRLNLTALSLLALVCGMFLIYNTMTFSVVRRRTQIGILRALGVTRREIFRQVTLEAVAIGLVGTGLGLVLGVVLAQGLVRLVTQTINDLYFVLTVRSLAVPPGALLRAALLGLGATLGAALHPAFEATAAPPRAVLTRSQLESGSRRGSVRAAWGGVALVALGLGLLALPGRSLPVAFGGLFAVIVGCAFLAPVATVAAMGLLARPARALVGVLGSMAARGVVAHLSRTGVAIAALTIAVSVTVGVGVMISSFRGTVERWLDLSLPADVYVSPPSAAGRAVGATIRPEAVDAIRATPGIERANTLRSAELATEDGPLLALALDLDDRGRSAFDLTAGRPDAAWPAVALGAVLVSEPYAYRQGLAPGDRITLPTARGPREFEIAGVYSDFGTQGAVLLDLGVYRSLFDDPGVSGISIFAAPGADPDELVDRLRRASGSIQRLEIRSNRTLKEASLAVFDRTFEVTEVLRLLAGLVAGIGVLAALLALQLERSRELAVLRANGMTPGQVWQLVTTQTGLMGLVAGLLSLPVGLILAAVMVYVINRRSFGWTLQMDVPATILVEAVALALVAALVAGLYPAWAMARTSPALALREE